MRETLLRNRHFDRQSHSHPCSRCGWLERNADVPREKRIEFRIGINLGDIIIDGGDIFGDGVNVAALSATPYRRANMMVWR